MLTLYLVGERRKYRDVDGRYKTEIVFYGKGYRSRESAYIRSVPYARLLQTAKEHNCTVGEASPFFIAQHNMWFQKKGAENFIAAYSTAEHPLYLITVSE